MFDKFKILSSIILDEAFQAWEYFYEDHKDRIDTYVAAELAKQKPSDTVLFLDNYRRYVGMDMNDPTDEDYDDTLHGTSNEDFCKLIDVVCELHYRDGAPVITNPI